VSCSSIIGMHWNMLMRKSYQHSSVESMNLNPDQLLFLNKNRSILKNILSPFPFETDCDNTANNIPSPAPDDVSQIT
jgi:hypothetical protein